MTHADINDLETRDYIFKIGDKGKAIQARYDENTDALIFPRAAFDYVFKLLKEILEQEPKTGKWIEHSGYDVNDEYGVEYSCTECNEWVDRKTNYCPNCGAKMESEEV